jgi:hypothetical protein
MIYFHYACVNPTHRSQADDQDHTSSRKVLFWLRIVQIPVALGTLRGIVWKPVNTFPELSPSFQLRVVPEYLARLPRNVPRNLEMVKTCRYFSFEFTSSPTVRFIHISNFPADHSPPSTAEVRSAWSYTSTPPPNMPSWCGAQLKHRGRPSYKYPYVIRSSNEVPRSWLASKFHAMFHQRPKGHWIRIRHPKILKI